MTRRRDDAAAQLAAAEALEPDSYAIPLARCVLIGFESRHADAEPECEEALRRAPGDGGALLQRAWLRYRLRRPKESVEDIAAAHRAGTNGGWSTRALIRQENGELDASLLDADEAIRGFPRDPSAWLAKARVSRARGDVTSALEFVRKAQDVLPPVSDVRALVEAELRELETIQNP